MRDCDTCSAAFEPSALGQGACSQCLAVESKESELCDLLDATADAEEEEGRRERLIDEEIDKLNSLIATLEDDEKRLNRKRIVQDLCDCVEALREATC